MADRLGKPPAEPPERLFRALLALRPQRPIAYRLRALPDVPLYVRALRNAEAMAAVDAGMAHPVEELRNGRVEIELLARCLMTPDGPAFVSAEDVEDLDGPEIEALIQHAMPALEAIGPTYSSSDTDAWRKVLEAGAEHGANLHDALVLANCVDHGFDANPPRPERYWGVAPCDLLDGHWLAFRAASAVKDKIIKSKKTKKA
ncbi:MAG: hypothetical protein E6R03_02580 [Hyphomicrobiaceae bacterium]|nr:MAG: hypothetical protein E6R03_02580 [Hyphomicrobiaceae bacterium]